jgi:D-cysteine desulfhydrase
MATPPRFLARTAGYDSAATALRALPRLPLSPAPTPLEELPRLRQALGGGTRLFVKRDDALAFAGGGNKVRKLEAVGAAALAAGADTLVTCGGVQSNHARVTAALAVRLGLRCIVIVKGCGDARPTGTHLLMRLLGAELLYVGSRADRIPTMTQTVDRLRADGSRPYLIPIGASTGLGAAGFTRGIAEILDQGFAPDIIVHASSSGGTQAGLLAGCTAFGLGARVIGVSVDEPAADIAASVRIILEELAILLDEPALGRTAVGGIEVDDRFIGDGYGIATAASIEAMSVLARTESLILDPVYTAKAMAALMAYVRGGRFSPDQTVLFWHTGGIPGLFA